jgi:hypothetical protein
MTCNYLINPNTLIALKSMVHTFLYGLVIIRPNCIITFNDMMLVVAPESNIHLCSKDHLLEGPRKVGHELLSSFLD